MSTAGGMLPGHLPGSHPRSDLRVGYGQVLQPEVREVQPISGVGDLHWGVLHVSPRQGELLHVTSHAHDRPQLTFWHESVVLQLTWQGPEPQVRLRHDPVPVQPMLHGPEPQLMFLQLCAPLHAIVHDRLFRQLTPLRHAFVVEHRMLQSQPVGHVIA